MSIEIMKLRTYTKGYKMDNKAKLKEYEAKLKEHLSKDESLKNSVATVGITCKITKKKYILKIKID